MSRLVCAWALLILVCLEASAVAAAIPRSWSPQVRWALWVAVLVIPAAFVGYALHVLGVDLLGGLA